MVTTDEQVRVTKEVVTRQGCHYRRRQRKREWMKRRRVSIGLRAYFRVS